MDGRRGLAARAGILTLSLAALAAAGDEGEWERPFAGVLPEPEPGTSVNPREEDPESERFTTGSFVVDYVSGRPIPGATLTAFPENDSAAATTYSAKAKSAAADAAGLAAVEVSAARVPMHWVIESSGCAPAYAYGVGAPAMVALRPGADVKGRLLDALGKPVEGAAIDAFPGGPHSPSVRAAHTAKDGTFALAAVSPTPVAWCTTTPVGSCRVAGGEPGLGRRVPDYVLTAGMTVRGRFVDAKDAPVAGVVVRATGFDREPIAVSDAGGRFALLCVPEHAGLRFQLPGRNESSTTDSLLGPLDCTVRLDADGRPAAPERDVKLSLRVQTGDGRAIDGEAVRFTRVSDGWSIVAVTADDTGEKPGTLAVDVPGGTYEVTQATPLEPATFAPFKWVVAAEGGTSPKSVTATRQPVLTVAGAVPHGAKVSLAVLGAEVACDGPVDAWHPPVPAMGAAVLRVQPLESQRAVFFFPVRDLAGAGRKADVALPAPHKVTIAGVATMLAERLTCDGLPVAYEIDGAALVTYADGPMVFDANLPGGARRFTFEIPAAAGAAVALDRAKGAAIAGPDLVRVKYALADGTVPADATMRVQSRTGGSSGTADAVIESEVPCRVTLALDGHQTLTRFFSSPAETKLVWGPCALELTVRDDAGAPAPSIVQVDGALHWTNAGVLALKGLDAGAHRVVVFPLRADLAGSELRLVLAGNETRRREVKLSKKKS
jgi:hypothetical protein